MRRFPDIESAGRRYLELRATRSELGGIDLVAARGEVCHKCGGGPSTLVKVGHPEKPNRQKWVEVCVDCREPWDGDAVELPSRWVSSSSSQSVLEDKLIANLDEWRVLERIFETEAHRGVDGHRFAPGRWAFSLKSFLVYTLPQWASYERVCQWAVEHEKETQLRDLFTTKRVRHSIPRAKAVLEKRARQEGILR